MAVQQLSAVGKVGLVFRLLFVAPTRLTYYLLTGLLPALHRRIPLRLFLNAIVIRVVLGSFSPLQIQLLAPSSLAAYKTWTRQKLTSETRAGRAATSAPKLRGTVERVPIPRPVLAPGTQLDRDDPGEHTTSIAWLGNRDTATKFVLFFHGGGFAVPLSPAHLEWCWQAYVAGAWGPGAQTDVAVAVVPYTLVPHARQPAQLREAASALAHLVSSRNVAPEDLLIGGDSAGGNLTMQLLRHLVQPHPDIAPVDLGLNTGGQDRRRRRLGGAFLVSPLVSNETSAKSYGENSAVDMLSAPMVAGFQAGFLPPGREEPEDRYRLNRGFVGPVGAAADVGWLDRLHEVAQSVYLTAGMQEVFRDDCVAFADALRSRAGPEVDVRVELPETEMHDVIFIEGKTGRVGDATERMKTWVASRFSS